MLADDEERLPVLHPPAAFHHVHPHHAGAAGAILTAPPLTIFTFSSPSVISSSAMPDSCTRSISFFSLRRSMASSPPGWRLSAPNKPPPRQRRVRCRPVCDSRRLRSPGHSWRFPVFWDFSREKLHFSATSL